MTRRTQRPLGSAQTGRAWARQGLEPVEIQAALERQAFKCMICGRGNRGMSWQVDHDHLVALKHNHPANTGCRRCFRGILCQTCNTALGNFLEDPEMLRRAATYIEIAREKMSRER